MFDLTSIAHAAETTQPTAVGIWPQIWPVLLGAGLAIIGGFFGTLFQEWRQRRSQRRVVIEFSIDLIDSLNTIFLKLNEHKNQTGVIWLNILDQIPVELAVYQRNREHLIFIRDVEIRRKVQDLFSRIATVTAIIQAAVLDHTKLSVESQRPDLPDAEKDRVVLRAKDQMRRAEEKYAELKDLLVGSRDVKARLQGFL